MSSADDKQRKALGKGLSALLPSRAHHAAAPAAAPAPAPASKTRPQVLPLDAIRPNQSQPRTVFEVGPMEELAASIRVHGVIQPIIVRETETGHQIVAGERRWRAARIAGLTEVPVVFQDVADPAMLEIALIENIQREDLNPIETARAYERLSRDLGLSQEEIARRTGKDRASIANTLRLLRLPIEVQTLIGERRLSAGQAKAILGLRTPDEQIALANRTVAEGLSVRRVEATVQEALSEPHSRREPRGKVIDPNIRAAQDALQVALGTRVQIIATDDKRGRFEIQYYSAEERDRIYNQLISSGQ